MIIETEIRNIRDKVDILKVYGPKILKNSSKDNQVRMKFTVGSKTSATD